MSPPALGVVLIALFGLSLATEFRPFYILLYTLAAGAVLAYLWAWLQSQGLKVEMESLTSYPQVGEPLRIRIKVSEGLGVPRMGLTVSLSGHLAAGQEQVLTIPSRDSATWTSTLADHRRGLNTIGPLIAMTSDPLGLVHWERRVGEPRSIVVFPTMVSVPPGLSMASTTLGHSYDEGRLPGAGASASGVRHYVPGDSLSHIHWPTTARLSQLMTKEFESDGHGEVWLFLDLQAVAQAGAGPDSTEEYSITLAASLLKSLTEAGQSVGLIAQGDTLCYFAPRRGQEHLWEVLAALALVRARGKSSLSSLIAQEGRALDPMSVAVVITPWQGQDLTNSLQPLYQRGATVVPALLDSASFGQGLDAQRSEYTAKQAQEQACLIYKGDDLALSLVDIMARLGY